MTKMTLCLARENGKILLGKKKRGFGMGKWNGYGGKVHEGESWENAARREWMEETETDAASFVLRGVLRLEGESAEHEVIEMRIYEVREITLQPFETEEMEQKWFLDCALPYKQMWPGDRVWMPYFLAGKPFHGTFWYAGDRLLRHEIHEGLETK